jgi:hypothetical protein
MNLIDFIPIELKYFIVSYIGHNDIIAINLLFPDISYKTLFMISNNNTYDIIINKLREYLTEFEWRKLYERYLRYGESLDMAITYRDVKPPSAIDSDLVLNILFKVTAYKFSELMKKSYDHFIYHTKLK